MKKKSPGRPRKSDALTSVIPVAISKGTAELLDRWAKTNGISRSAAVRMLLDTGLAEFAAKAAEAGKGKPRQKRSPK